MQTITTRVKYLLSILLILSLLLSLDGFTVNDTSLCATSTCESLVIRPPESIWSSIRSQLALDHKEQSPSVKAGIRRVLADKDKLYSILQSSAPYIYYILKETQARKLPAELALIPVIESEFNPNDHSKKGATGLWQLMPSTARDLGIKVKGNYDGRRNVVASTKAALAYFGDLKTLFKNDWYLVIGAYNCGEGQIKRAIRRKGSRDFWSLNLPAETKAYVPTLLAIAAIIKDPEKYGVKLPPIQNKPYFIALNVTKPVSLSKIAKSTSTNIETLHKLNPDYRHEKAALPDKHGAYTLLVPVKAVAAVKTKLNDSGISAKEKPLITTPPSKLA